MDDGTYSVAIEKDGVPRQVQGFSHGNAAEVWAKQWTATAGGSGTIRVWVTDHKGLTVELEVFYWTETFYQAQRAYG
jgi:hypothetical protein